MTAREAGGGAMSYPHIRYGTSADIGAVQHIARQFNRELGFVRRASLERAIANRELYVASLDTELVGFVNWHTRRDGWRTVYELGVHRDYHDQSIGRNLLYAVPTPTRLKCTTDNERANRFYAGTGMQLAAVEQGRKRALNV
jgi:ribosomal protein S18 acetylase RimI-like enzyme